MGGSHGRLRGCPSAAPGSSCPCRWRRFGRRSAGLPGPAGGPGAAVGGGGGSGAAEGGGGGEETDGGAAGGKGGQRVGRAGGRRRQDLLLELPPPSHFLDPPWLFFFYSAAAGGGEEEEEEEEEEKEEDAENFVAAELVPINPSFFDVCICLRRPLGEFPFLPLVSPPFLADTSSALAITEEPYIVFVPLVSGSHLLVSALPEEYLDVWFFCEMTSLCFRICAWLVPLPQFQEQIIEVVLVTRLWLSSSRHVLLPCCRFRSSLLW